MRDRLRHAPTMVWVGGLTVIVLLGAFKMVPWLTADRPLIASSPSLGGVISAAYPTVRPGQQACIAPAPIPKDSIGVMVLAGRGADTSPVPLRFTVSAPGYRASVKTSAPWPAGGSVPITVRLPEPPQEDLVGRVCVRNLGDVPVTLAGTEEPRSQVVAKSTVDGKLVPDLSLTIYDRQTSVLTALPTLVDRAATMASLPPTAIAWLVALLLMATPFAAVWALALAFREPEPGDGPTAS